MARVSFSQKRLSFGAKRAYDLESNTFNGGIMNKLTFRWMILVVLGAFAIGAVSAQQTPRADKYLISATAGGVNFTQGSVSVARGNDTGGLLLTGDQIGVGDKVSTGVDGRVEVLLNPGSYLRLGENSSMQFETTSLDDLKLKLDSGSAMFEVFATNEFTISVITSEGKITLIDSGVYRVDVVRDGAVTVAVTEGKALVGKTVVKEGRFATVSENSVDVGKFDRGKRDELAAWSRSRAKELAKSTSSLKNRDVRTALLNSFSASRWNIFGSFGLWVFDPFSRRYCFLPFGYGWNSPYGYGFGTDIWWYNLPPIVFNPPPPGTPPVRTAPIRVRTTRAESDQSPVGAPPYTKIERQREINTPTRRNEFPMEPTKPVRQTPPQSPPIIVMPPPARAPRGKKPDGR